MSLSTTQQVPSQTSACPVIGIGLRHQHYQEALQETAAIDFVEIHAENFFAQGGLVFDYLEQLKTFQQISLHSVSMGLGSAIGIKQSYIDKIKTLSDRVNPLLISDHACFCWAKTGEQIAHAGDLLPLERTPTSLNLVVENVDKVQTLLGRTILIENISSYFPDQTSTISEPEFLAELSRRTGCNLLIDLNNILVNAHNFESENALSYAKRWLKQIPPPLIGEYHLAGSSPAPTGELLIDDHAKPVSNNGWELFKTALIHSGPKPTLIEWDNNLPTWEVLIEQAKKAREITAQVINHQASDQHANNRQINNRKVISHV